MLPLIISLPVFLCTRGIFAQSANGTYKAFPEAWAGDSYDGFRLPTGAVPGWLDGVFLCQLSASYGRKAPGRGMTHLADGLAAVAAFDLHRGGATFSAAYYPSEWFKTWDFYDRSFERSGVAWKPRASPFNVTPAEAWDRIPSSGYIDFNPNVDFWKIGHDIVGGAGEPQLGLSFNPLTLDDFRPYRFFDTNDVFSRPDDFYLINMVAQPRTDLDGTVWSTVAALDKTTFNYYQVVFTVSPNRERNVQGMYRWANFDPEKCDLEGHYFGDLRNLPGFMHFVTSTKNYLILPVSSSMLNPCRRAVRRDGDLEFIPKMGFNRDVPIRFLLFDKRSKFFLPVIEGPKGRFPSHHFNAYEREDGTLVVDMITYTDMNLYNKYLTVDFVENNAFPSAARLSRFVLNTKNLTSREFPLLSDVEQGPFDFPQINHQYDGQYYRYGYVLQYPFSAGSSIVKLDLLDPSGIRNKVFDPGERFALSEPWFVSHPGGSVREDDGVLLVRSVDLTNENSYLYVLDAKSMRLLGEAALYGEIIPFGFHNRFYQRSELTPPVLGPTEPSRLVVDLYPPLIPDRVEMTLVDSVNGSPDGKARGKPATAQIKYATPPRIISSQTTARPFLNLNAAEKQYVIKYTSQTLPPRRSTEVQYVWRNSTSSTRPPQTDTPQHTTAAATVRTLAEQTPPPRTPLGFAANNVQSLLANLIPNAVDLQRVSAGAEPGTLSYEQNRSIIPAQPPRDQGRDSTVRLSKGSRSESFKLRDTVEASSLNDRQASKIPVQLRSFGARASSDQSRAPNDAVMEVAKPTRRAAAVDASLHSSVLRMPVNRQVVQPLNADLTHMALLNKQNTTRIYNVAIDPNRQPQFPDWTNGTPIVHRPWQRQGSGRMKLTEQPQNNAHLQRQRQRLKIVGRVAGQGQNFPHAMMYRLAKTDGEQKRFCVQPGNILGILGAPIC